ncbi:MAG: hypothetical protein AAFR10_01635 [Pseudomonadota bacterium]
MSEMQELPGLFDANRVPSAKQVAFASALARKSGTVVPQALLSDRVGLSAWIDRHKARGTRAAYPSSKQVAFAERIARIKRRQIPEECFRDKTMMSRWIDSNKPR